MEMEQKLKEAKKVVGLKEYLANLDKYYMGLIEWDSIGYLVEMEQKLKEAKKVVGLKKHLYDISKYYGCWDSIEDLVDAFCLGYGRMDLQINTKEQVAAYVIEKQDIPPITVEPIWKFRVGAFRKGKGINSGTLLYHDMFEALDDIKIKTLKVTPCRVIVGITSGEKEKYFEFDIY